MVKRRILEAIIRKLEEERDSLIRAAQSARDEATDPESRQEGKYDMRAQTAAYLAEGQAKMAGDLAAAIAAFRAMPAESLPRDAAAEVGALVTIQSKAETLLYFLGPQRGGLEITLDGAAITVVTPGSTLGSRLLGMRAGETNSLGTVLAVT